MLYSPYTLLIALGFRFAMIRVRFLRFVRGIGRPRIGTVGHVTIPVHDLDEARRFYCDVLGGALFMRVDNEYLKKLGRPILDPNAQSAFHISVLFGSSTRIDLFLQNFGQAQPDHPHPHYAFRVPARDLAKWKARLDRHGIPSDGPLRLGPPGQASLYFNDPFGNHLELETFGYSEKIPARPPEWRRTMWPGQKLAAE